MVGSSVMVALALLPRKPSKKSDLIEKSYYGSALVMATRAAADVKNFISNFNYKFNKLDPYKNWLIF